MALLAVIALVGCGGSSEPKTAADAPAATTDGGGSERETLTVSISGDINDFDPHTQQLLTFTWAIRHHVFEPLVRYDANMEIAPALATSWEPNEDATSWTFELDPAARFHDGTPVDAEAVIASFRRLSRQPGIWATKISNVKGYTAVDEHTIRIDLTEPDAAFPDDLTDLAVIAPSSFRSARTTPVGSGPYRFVHWRANDEIVIERNDAWRGEPPKIRRIVYKPVSDPQVALTNLRGGQLDVITEPPTSLYNQARSAGAKLVEPEFSFSLALIEMSTTRGEFADRRVRQALAHAFDKESIRKIAYRDLGDSFWTPSPPGLWTYLEDGPGYEYDLEKARALLAEAGAENLSFTLTVLQGYPEAQQTARIWQQSLREIGVDMRILVEEVSVWLDRYVGRDWTAIWNISPVSGDPAAFYAVMMGQHFAGDYRNPEMQRLMAEGLATTDRDARTDIYHRLDEMVVDDLPIMVVQSRPLAVIVREDVEGVVVDARGWVRLENAQ